VKSAMTLLDDSEAMFLFVAWGSDEDLRHIAIPCFLKSFLLIQHMGPIEKSDPFWCLLVLTATGITSWRCEPSFLPSFLQFRYVFKVLVVIPLLVERSIVERINKINTDGNRKIYNPSSTVY
jgi:hypothetical protein